MNDRANRDRPPAPWELRGEALAAIRLVPARAALALLPAAVRLVCPYPGRTLAIAYLARYRESPVGDYCELIVAPGIVRMGAQVGFWISHIVVDSTASRNAGRSIWALPKELGTFDWRPQYASAVAAGIRVHAAFASHRTRVRLPFAGTAMSRLGTVRSWFIARGAATVGRTHGTFDLQEPRLRALGFERSRALFVLTNMQLHVGVPTQAHLPANDAHAG